MLCGRTVCPREHTPARDRGSTADAHADLGQRRPRHAPRCSTTVSAALLALATRCFVLELVGAYASLPHVALAESHRRRAPPQVAKASRTLIQGIRVASRGAWPCLALLCRAAGAGRLGGTLGGGSPEARWDWMSGGCCRGGQPSTACLSAGSSGPAGSLEGRIICVSATSRSCAAVALEGGGGGTR